MMWTVKIQFKDGITMTEEVHSYGQVRNRFQTWRADDRHENDRPVIVVFPPYSLAGATA